MVCCRGLGLGFAEDEGVAHGEIGGVFAEVGHVWVILGCASVDGTVLDGIWVDLLGWTKGNRWLKEREVEA